MEFKTILWIRKEEKHLADNEDFMMQNAKGIKWLRFTRYGVEKDGKTGVTDDIADRQTDSRTERQRITGVDKDSSFFETKNGFVKKYEMWAVKDERLVESFNFQLKGMHST